MLRSEMEEKQRFRVQAEGIAASAGRFESAARSAKFTADKARAEVAVLEGALTGSKVGHCLRVGARPVYDRQDAAECIYLLVTEHTKPAVW